MTKFAAYVAWILLCESSKFGEKIIYSNRYNEFFRRGRFLLAHPVHTCIVCSNRRRRQTEWLMILTEEIQMLALDRRASEAYRASCRDQLPSDLNRCTTIHSVVRSWNAVNAADRSRARISQLISRYKYEQVTSATFWSSHGWDVEPQLSDIICPPPCYTPSLHLMILWPFDLRVDACRGPAVDDIYQVTNLVLLAQAVFILERGRTHIHHWLSYPRSCLCPPCISWCRIFPVCHITPPYLYFPQICPLSHLWGSAPSQNFKILNFPENLKW